MTATTLTPTPFQKFFDNNGLPLAFGTVLTLQAGTNTPAPTYTDNTGVTPNPNPIVLDARGEASIWIPPNVAYKYVIADSGGNQIRTQDQIIVSQLITLYGGVDTGVANAYVINFVASFTGLTDGIQITWIPSNTNTAASTINVNGLGVQPILNANGSSQVTAGQIIASQPTTIMFLGGNWLLLTPVVPLFGFFTPTYTGFTTPPVTGQLEWRRTAGEVSILLDTVTSTSNATSFTITGLPAIITPIQTVYTPCIGLEDNSANLAGGAASINPSGVITFFKDGTLNASGWTASGLKGITVNNIVLKYTLP